MDSERFTYQIIPRRPIRNLIPGQSITKPCSVKLTKEEVHLCMDYASVYRYFPKVDDGLVKVTGDNIDRLHRSEYISEDSAPSVEEMQEETPVVIKTEEVQSEVKKEKEEESSVISSDSSEASIEGEIENNELQSSEETNKEESEKVVEDIKEESNTTDSSSIDEMSEPKMESSDESAEKTIDETDKKEVESVVIKEHSDKEIDTAEPDVKKEETPVVINKSQQVQFTANNIKKNKK